MGINPAFSTTTGGLSVITAPFSAQFFNRLKIYFTAVISKLFDRHPTIPKPSHNHHNVKSNPTKKIEFAYLKILYVTSQSQQPTQPLEIPLHDLYPTRYIPIQEYIPGVRYDN